jgi:KDO2-lipid IV(A) lauroyltransferase
VDRAVYLLAYPLLWLIARLPFPLLYSLSDGVYFIIYRLVGYRKKVVRTNLQLVFPNRDTEELRKIEKKFYAHMCDMFLEMLKTMAISQEEILRRFTYTNLEVVKEFEDREQSFVIFMSHYGSWEWALSINQLIRNQGFGTYLPISNKYFDRLVRKIRAKFGLTLVTTRQTAETMARNHKEGVLATYGLISDQSPQLKKDGYWGKFMGIEVPMHVGAEQLCRRYNLPAILLNARKVKRGYYQGTFEVLAEDPNSLPRFGITDAFFRATEALIEEAPEYYLWTHRRWKHRGKKPVSTTSSN